LRKRIGAGWVCSSIVEGLPSMCKVLGAIISTEKEEKEEKEKSR
jgi:hypothetical protein